MYNFFNEQQIHLTLEIGEHDLNLRPLDWIQKGTLKQC